MLDTIEAAIDDIKNGKLVIVVDEEERENRRGPISRNRIESLSDLVFGLTLSVGALALIAQPPTTRMSTGIKVY